MILLIMYMCVHVNCDSFLVNYSIFYIVPYKLVIKGSLELGKFEYFVLCKLQNFLASVMPYTCFCLFVSSGVGINCQIPENILL